MLLSMTGQGSATLTADGTTVTVEIRAVNNRHLKINLRCPDSLITLESVIEKSIRSVVGRGTVNVNIKVEKHSRAGDFSIDLDLLTSYRQQLQTETIADVSTDTLLSLPGVVTSKSGADNSDASRSLILRVVEEALFQFNQMRVTEGEALSSDLDLQIERLTALIVEIRQHAPLVIQRYSDRLTEKLNQLLQQHNVTLSDSDLAREIGIFADRCDITEEVVRLDSHLKQFRDVMESQISQGRKLDFITQELFREINTIGSKANDASIANCVVESKTVVERIREQVQNCE
ncbi:MAG: YicC/YloC family endoribonuclease [Planctomycetaceae bacterium]